MSIADTIRRLAAAGATPEAIAIVVEAIEAINAPPVVTAEQDCARRTAAAARQANYRKRLKERNALQAKQLETLEKRNALRNVMPPANQLELLDDHNALRNVTSLQGSPPLVPPSLSPLHPPITTPLNPPTPISLEARARKDEFVKLFWPAYPHKVGKPKALASFQSARRKASFSEIEEGLRRYILEKPPDRPWCNPATWLNQERWADQPATVTPSPRGQHEAPRRTLVDAGRDRVAFLREQELQAEQGSRNGDVVVQFLPESRLR